jgi:DNA-binding CsgD family transcriptional regulator
MKPILSTEQIYDCVFDNEAFATLPVLLAEGFDASAGSISWRRSGRGTTIAQHSGYYSDAALSDYEANYADSDPWVPAACLPGNLGRPILMDEVVGTKTLHGTRFYNDWLRGQGDDAIHCMASATMTLMGEGIVTLLRGGASVGSFTAEDAAQLDAILPHLTRVLSLRGKLAIEMQNKQWVEAALDAAGYAMVAVDGTGRIHMTNAGGEALLQKGLLKTRDFSTALAMDRELASAIAAATQASQPLATAVLMSLGDVSCPVQVTPFAAPSGSRIAILLIRDQADQTMRAGSLRQLYGLTAAEVEVAILLADGSSPAAISIQRATSLETVRSQIRTIKIKTGCKRQAELVTLFNNLPV